MRNLARGFVFYTVLLLAGGTVAAQGISETSGFVTLRIKGTGGQGTSALSFIGIGLARPAAYQGTVSSIQANMITDIHAGWADDQFNGQNGLHYLEITSGAKAGFVTDILTTSGTTKTLTLADDLSSGLLGGENFTIRKHWTLASLFGPNNEAGLASGSNLTADEILIFHPVTKAYTTYLYKTTGLGATGWRSAAHASKDESNSKLELTQGILIRRKQPSDLQWKVFGAVKLGNTFIEVQSGLNILANVYPGGRLTLGNSHLYTGDPATGLADGSVLTADKVLIYDGTTYQTYYYKTLGIGGLGWRSTANSSLDASGTLIPSGSSVLVQRIRNRPAFFWVVEAPF